MTETGEEASAMLEARAVSKVYPGEVRALERITLEVGAGETVALVGGSGSGKTTLLRMFNRMVAPSAGEILVDGQPARQTEIHSLRRHIGYVPQSGGLLPHWTVARNVALVPSLLGWPRQQRRRLVERHLDRVGLPAGTYAARYPAALSGGERQRVALARAFAADPKVVLMDEPFGALDAITRRQLQQEFLELSDDLDKTILLVTHDLAEAVLLADRIAVLERGRLVQVGTHRQLVERPADAYVERLLDTGLPSP
ncbi:MAG: ATP-binding cassette domain-containing protein [Thermoanaerobaculia bacterium]|nr:ATP-binding cassette domain-containing protein [Thermoanaerobaculia bacterium]